MWGTPKLPGEKREGGSPKIVATETGEVIRAETDEELAAKLRENAVEWKEAA